MKKITLLAMFFGLSLPVFAFFPFFHGARSLALGYSSLAFNYDVNALFINPALLNSLNSSMGGYQYQNSYLDFRNFGSDLAAILAHNLNDFAALREVDREALLVDLKELFSSKASASGFQLRNPGYAGKGYAVALATIDAAVIHPLENSILSKPATEITSADIASLCMRFVGFHYNDYSVAFAVPLSRIVAVGTTVHYLKGRNTEFTASLVNRPFGADSDVKDLLKYAWSAAEHDFSKLNCDLGASAVIGPYFQAGLAMKNVFAPSLSMAGGELKLERRLVAGLSFRPDAQLGIFVDVDTNRVELFQDGVEAQPLSVGVEKGFFRNKLSLRAGLWSDLAAEYFLGRRSKALYGLGCGFNLGKFMVDLAMGIDAWGRVKNLGISGFYLMR